MTNIDNPLLQFDSYKLSHKALYPDDLEFVSSYIESRGGRWGHVMFFGLQMFLQKMKPFTADDITEFHIVSSMHGFDVKDLVQDLRKILTRYGGHWPVEIQAVKEGTIVPTGNVLVQIHNTDPEFPWITQFLETELLRAIWYPTTVATLSYHIKQSFKDALDRTSDISDAVLSTRLHDFGARGATSREAAGIGGVAHLANFIGTDNMTALMYAQKFYSEPMAGFSIPATEHSISCSFGQDNELGYAQQVVSLLETGKYPYVACVSDTYNVYNFVSDVIGTQLRERIIATGKTLVIRPDSGDPTIVPLEIIEILGDKFGYTTNSKGFKVLHSAVRVVQGDGMNEKKIGILLANLEVAGWSAENIVVGMGGGLLQSVNRDTLKFAQKASAIRKRCTQIEGISKDPITDPGKTSKKGCLALVKSNGHFETVVCNPGDEYLIQNNLLDDVWTNGQQLRHQTLSEIRALSELS